MSTLSTHSNSETSSSNELMKTCTALIERIRLERKKYNEFTIIKEILSEDCQFSPELQTKIRDILMTAELDTELNTLLGLPSLNVPELTYEEKLQVKTAVESGIIKKSGKLFQELDELGVTYNDKTRSETWLGLSSKDEVLIDFKKELNEEQRLYILKLEELISVLEQIIKLKLEEFPVLSNEKLNVFDIKTKLYKLQSEVINAKLKQTIFTETDCSLEAYRQLINDVLQQQTECKQEIDELEKSQERYKLVSCMQYSEILRKYLRYKAMVDKKKSLYNKIQRNKE